MPWRSAIKRRARGLRRDPLDTVTTDLDWIGTLAIERTVPQRSRHGVGAAYRGALYRGRDVVCPVCERRLRRFVDAPNRANAICPACHSAERHRELWLFLERWPPLRRRPLELLHFAPEPCLEPRLRALEGVRYRSCDLDSPLVDDNCDITALPYTDARFDVVICSHVLEHVEDDRAALSELHRVLAPDGHALLLIPIDHGREETYEDPAIVTPQERERAFWQHDHVRLYGRDFAQRVAATGFEVEVERVWDRLDPAARARFGLIAEGEIYVARK